MPRKIIAKTGEAITVDNEDFGRLNEYTWRISRKGYAYAWIDGSNQTMHRYLVGLKTGDKKQVDHANRNRLDCRKSNLRIVTSKQNNMNRKKISGCSSKYKGVTHRADCWEVQIKIDGKAKYIGRFKSEEEAARAYDKEARRLFGKFAVLNFS